MGNSHTSKQGGEEGSNEEFHQDHDDYFTIVNKPDDSRVIKNQMTIDTTHPVTLPNSSITKQPLSPPTSQPTLIRDSSQQLDHSTNEKKVERKPISRRQPTMNQLPIDRDNSPRSKLIASYNYLFDRLFLLEDFRGLFTHFVSKNKEWSSTYQKQLDFMEHVRQFHSKTSPQNRFYLAKIIMKDYIRRDAENRIELSEAIRQDIIGEFDSFCSETMIPCRLFDDAVRNVAKQLSEGPFDVFVKSPIFQHYMKDKLYVVGDVFLQQVATPNKIPANSQS